MARCRNSVGIPGGFGGNGGFSGKSGIGVVRGLKSLWRKLPKRSRWTKLGTQVSAKNGIVVNMVACFVVFACIAAALFAVKAMQDPVQASHGWCKALVSHQCSFIASKLWTGCSESIGGTCSLALVREIMPKSEVSNRGWREGGWRPTAHKMQLWDGFPCATPLCPPTPFRNLWQKSFFDVKGDLPFLCAWRVALACQSSSVQKSRNR